MTKIVVDPQQLKTVANQVENKKNEYLAAVNKLYNSVDAMSNAWQGEDNQAYAAQIKGFQDDFQKMGALLQQYADFLKSSAQAYEQTQDNVANAARSLTN